MIHPVLRLTNVAKSFARTAPKDFAPFVRRRTGWIIQESAGTSVVIARVDAFVSQNARFSGRVKLLDCGLKPVTRGKHKKSGLRRQDHSLKEEVEKGHRGRIIPL